MTAADTSGMADVPDAQTGEEHPLGAGPDKAVQPGPESAPPEADGSGLPAGAQPSRESDQEVAEHGHAYGLMDICVFPDCGRVKPTWLVDSERSVQAMIAKDVPGARRGREFWPGSDAVSRFRRTPIGVQVGVAFVATMLLSLVLGRLASSYVEGPGQGRDLGPVVVNVPNFPGGEVPGDFPPGLLPSLTDEPAPR